MIQESDNLRLVGRLVDLLVGWCVGFYYMITLVGLFYARISLTIMVSDFIQ